MKKGFPKERQVTSATYTSAQMKQFHWTLFSATVSHTWDASLTASGTTSLSVSCCQKWPQTPKSLRGKLWQIERALKFGPEDISQPQCCIVCLNGEEGQFEAAAEAAREELSILAQDAALNNFPVFAIFTEYRNTYAELRQVNQKVDDVNQKVDDVNQKVDYVNQKVDDVNQKVDYVNQKVDDVNQKVDYVNQKVDDLQKDLKEIRDLLVRRDGQNNSANWRAVRQWFTTHP